MGLSSSTLASNEVPDHFADIVNPKKSGSAVRETESEPKHGFESKKRRVTINSVHAGSFEQLPPPKSTISTNVSVNSRGQQVVKLDSRAAIVKKLDDEKLWAGFLRSDALSFALPQSEVCVLLKSSLLEDAFPDGPRREADVEDCIQKYLELVSELSENDMSPKTFDFMAILSSVLFLAPRTIEDKIDQIFEWVTLNDSSDSFDFNEFYVALSSFERGLSHAMGKKSFNEETVKQVSTGADDAS